jgi:hypothetical protein
MERRAIMGVLPRGLDTREVTRIAALGSGIIEKGAFGTL